MIPSSKVSQALASVGINPRLSRMDSLYFVDPNKGPGDVHLPERISLWWMARDPAWHKAALKLGILPVGWRVDNHGYTDGNITCSLEIGIQARNWDEAVRLHSSLTAAKILVALT